MYNWNNKRSVVNYSTSEQDTGIKWIDGKKIYQKTINFGTLPNTTIKTVAHGISNLNRVISIDGYAYRSSDSTILPIMISSTDATNASSIRCAIKGSNIEIITGTDRTAFTECYVILKYTKTTG